MANEEERMETAMESVVESLLNYSITMMTIGLEEFIGWFVEKGGKVVFPQGHSSESIVKLFIEESQKGAE